MVKAGGASDQDAGKEANGDSLLSDDSDSQLVDYNVFKADFWPALRKAQTLRLKTKKLDKQTGKTAGNVD